MECLWTFFGRQWLFVGVLGARIGARRGSWYSAAEGLQLDTLPLLLPSRSGPLRGHFWVAFSMCLTLSQVLCICVTETCVLSRIGDFPIPGGPKNLHTYGCFTIKREISTDVATRSSRGILGYPILIICMIELETL